MPSPIHEIKGRPRGQRWVRCAALALGVNDFAMRVVYLSPAAELGGAERCLIDCIAALRDSGSRVAVSVLALADGPLVAEARALGAEVEVIAPPRELSQFGESRGSQTAVAHWRQLMSAPATLRFFAALAAAIARRKPDVVHSNGMKAHLLAGLLAPPRTRLVVHLHDFIGSRRASRRLLPLLARLRRRSTFVANSNAVAKDFRQLAPHADVRTVYNVVDVDYFAPGAGEPTWLAARAELAPPAPKAISFGLVATYARWKGHGLFIDAAGRLKAAHPNQAFRFYVVGSPIYSTAGSQVSGQELQLAANEAGISECFGLVPFQGDVARVYRSLNVVVHASIQPEPFGRAIVEAMACARPVIVSRAGGAVELFLHGENAWGVPPCDAAALSEAMGTLLEPAKRTQLGDAARAHAVAHFSRTRLAPQLLALYQAER
jgi:glycosyltransferase involved in cell wall biosynthesis